MQTDLFIHIFPARYRALHWGAYPNGPATLSHTHTTASHIQTLCTALPLADHISHHHNPHSIATEPFSHFHCLSEAHCHQNLESCHLALAFRAQPWFCTSERPHFPLCRDVFSSLVVKRLDCRLASVLNPGTLGFARARPLQYIWYNS